MFLSPMKNCGMKEFVGVNEDKFDFKDFKRQMINDYGMDGFSEPPSCVIFSGAYDVRGSHGTQVTGRPIRTKKLMLKRCEDIKKFLEDETLGIIVDIPDFTNANHKTIVVPWMLFVDRTEFHSAINRWKKDKIEAKVTDNTPTWQL